MIVTLLAAGAWACSLAPNQPFEIVLDPSDTTAPLQPELQELTIRRGKGPQRVRGNRYVSTSCDDIGMLDLTFAQPEGDEHSPETLGYAVRFVDGDLPGGLEPWEGLWAGPRVSLHWIDGATDDQEPFGFVLEVMAVDVAGNTSPPLLVDVRDPGSQSGTCASAPGLAVGWPAVLLAGAFARRRRSL